MGQCLNSNVRLFYNTLQVNMLVIQGLSNFLNFYWYFLAVIIKNCCFLQQEFRNIFAITYEH